MAYGYDDNGMDAAAWPVRPGSGTPNQYVYDEDDNDDYKVFPPPGPGTVIESGYTIVPLTAPTWDGDRDDEAPLLDYDDLFASIAAAMAAEQQRGTPVAAVVHGATEAGSAAARLPSVRCYGGTVADGYGEDYDDGRDAAPPLVRLGSGSPNQYVYNEHDNDDYKAFPPPGPGTVIESTGHGYTIVPMTVTCDDDGDDQDAPPVQDDLLASIAAAMAAEQKRGTPVAVVEHGAFEAGSSAGRPPPVPSYGGTVACGYEDEYEDGRDAAPAPPVGGFGSGMVNQYVYDEYDSDDYKVFPPPGPGTVIESTGHGYTIVPMTAKTCDGREDGSQPPAYHDLFPSVIAADQQRKTPMAAAPGKDDVGRGDVMAAAKDCAIVAVAPAVEVDDEEERDGYELCNAKDDHAEQGITTAKNIKKASPSAWVVAAAERALKEAAARFTAVRRRLIRRGGGRRQRNSKS